MFHLAKITNINYMNEKNKLLKIILLTSQNLQIILTFTNHYTPYVTFVFSIFYELSLQTIMESFYTTSHLNVF